MEKWGPRLRLIACCWPQGGRFDSSSLGWGYPGVDVLSLGFPVSQGSVSQSEPQTPPSMGTAGDSGGTSSYVTRFFTRHAPVGARE